MGLKQNQFETPQHSPSHRAVGYDRGQDLMHRIKRLLSSDWLHTRRLLPCLGR